MAEISLRYKIKASLSKNLELEAFLFKSLIMLRVNIRKSFPCLPCPGRLPARANYLVDSIAQKRQFLTFPPDPDFQLM